MKPVNNNYKMMMMKLFFLDMAFLAASAASAGGRSTVEQQLFMNKQHSSHAALHLPSVVTAEDQTAVPGCSIDDDAVANDPNSTTSQGSLLDSSPSLSPASPSPVVPQEEGEQEFDNHDILQPGTIVELYSDSSYFAIPALILDLQHQDDESSYIVENTITHKIVPNISSHYIHPYVPYADGTRASCNISKRQHDAGTTIPSYMEDDDVYMTPCVIQFHITRPASGLVIYQVSYLDHDTEEIVEELLPLTRVQRVHGQRNGLRGRKL